MRSRLKAGTSGLLHSRRTPASLLPWLRESLRMKMMKDAAPSAAAGGTMEGSQEAKKEILAILDVGQDAKSEIPAGTAGRTAGPG